ncbi:MAG: tail protein X [Blautia sp.]|mgnify:FL=1|uniref:tail protein X n=1 Tax=Fusicatenibacter saccharivorans TaxID=1150298 RepID=UPI00156FCE4F|nr:tail protein X [Clostridiales bacterium]MDU7833684.1 tail protein X [Blautia sp.]NSD63436.1 phage tail protein [Fusicatenibacter saccharivorans]DAP66236.1 MAG TPA: tail protein [Caudoviricetes sp.]
MGTTYTTIQGDTWDLISFKLFGSEKYMKNLIEANWPLLETLVFSSGTVITVPDLPEESDEDAPFWRQTVDNSDDVIYEYAEGDEDG